MRRLRRGKPPSGVNDQLPGLTSVANFGRVSMLQVQQVAASPSLSSISKSAWLFLPVCPSSAPNLRTNSGFVPAGGPFPWQPISCGFLTRSRPFGLLAAIWLRDPSAGPDFALQPAPCLEPAPCLGTLPSALIADSHPSLSEPVGLLSLLVVCFIEPWLIGREQVWACLGQASHVQNAVQMRVTCFVSRKQ